MSALAYSYSEPYKLPAGILALAVHLVFFALLYFGVSWQTRAPQGMMVDIWDNLPEPVQAPAAQPAMAPPPPPPPPVEPPKPVAPPRPVAPPKADIALPEKKKQKEPEPKKEELRKPPTQQLKQTAPKISEAEKARLAAQAEQDRARAAQAAQQAAAAAAITSEVGKYTGLIRSKVRRNIVMPPDVPDSAQAEFEVKLLPDGEVLGDPQLVKSSGNAAYDAAVERAILKAQPFPLPADLAAKKEFINPKKLLLKFSPKE